MTGSEPRSSSPLTIGSLFDPFWDYGPRGAVDDELTARFAHQLEAAKQTKFCCATRFSRART